MPNKPEVTIINGQTNPLKNDFMVSNKRYSLNAETNSNLVHLAMNHFGKKPIVTGSLSTENPKCKLHLNTIKFDRFVFTDCTFEDAWVDCSEFHNCQFINCTFKKGHYRWVKFNSCSFEDCTFNLTYARKVNFSKTSTAKNVVFKIEAVDESVDIFGTRYRAADYDHGVSLTIKKHPLPQIDQLKKELKQLEEKREERVNKYILPVECKIDKIKDKLESLKQS